MEEFIEIYKELLKHAPAWLQAVVGTILIVYIKNPTIRKSFNKFISKTFKVLNGKGILTHELFYHEKLFYAHLSRINFACSIKTKMFVILLTEKIKASIFVTRDILKKELKFIRTAHPAEVVAILLNILPVIIKTYEKNIKDAYIREFGIYGKDAYNIVYAGKSGFKQYHEPKINTIRDDIDALGFISANYNDIVRLFLYQIMFAIQKAIFDCITVFNNLNGELSEVIDKIKKQ